MIGTRSTHRGGNGQEVHPRTGSVPRRAVVEDYGEGQEEWDAEEIEEALQ